MRTIGFSAFVFLIPPLVLFAFEARGAEFRIQPSLSISEEYNDNVFLEPENRDEDYITRVVPSVSSTYKSSLWDWDVSYAYDYRYYARGSRDEDETHTLRLTNRTRIVKELFFLDIRDEYQRVSLDVTRDFTRESLFVNQSDRNFFTVNPYITVHPTARMTVTTGYIYANTWYKDPRGIDKVDNTGYVEVKQEASPRLTMTTALRHTRNENDVQDYTRDDLSFGPRYEYAEGSNLWFTLGGSRLDFEETGRTSQITWDAGVIHKFPKVTFSFETGLRYVEDPLHVLRREDRYVASVKRETERTSYGVSAGVREYRDAETMHLLTRSYRTTGDLSHTITQKLRGAYHLTIEKLENFEGADTFTVRYLTAVRFEYLLSETLTLALDYRYTDSYSPDVREVNYENNRIAVELTKRFF